MKNVPVYNQLKESTKDCLSVLNREIGLKTTCSPFAVKLIEALNTLQPKTDNDKLMAADTLLSGLQTLMQGGIKAEDYDKIDFVKRGNAIVVSARVEAFLRACARKGYRITDTIVAVPKEDCNTTYFEENFYNGEIIYILKDERHNPDRTVTAQRLADRYFKKFLCRLEVRKTSTNERVAMSVCEMDIEDLINISNTSDQGIYKAQWVPVQTPYGTKKKREVSNELNTAGFWFKWTSEMVNKTIIRRALKRIKEVLPELKEQIYAFDKEEEVQPYVVEKEEIDLTIPVIEAPKVNLDNLTEEQLGEAKEMLEVFTANPKLAEEKTKEIEKMIESKIAPEEIIKREYASLVILKKSKEKWNRIGGYFND